MPWPSTTPRPATMPKPSTVPSSSTSSQIREEEKIINQAEEGPGGCLLCALATSLTKTGLKTGIHAPTADSLRTDFHEAMTHLAWLSHLHRDQVRLCLHLCLQKIHPHRSQGLLHLRIFPQLRQTILITTRTTPASSSPLQRQRQASKASM